MAHEITRTDGLMLTGAPAWHGLGTIVENAPSPREALKLAGLDWRVEQTPGVASLIMIDGRQVRLVADTHVINFRSDTHEVLGVVGADYEPVQNADLVDFVEALNMPADGIEAEVGIESAGSIRGGKRVWFLSRGQSFGVGKGGRDEVRRYLLVAAGHDGTLPVIAQPTSIRVVCSNTLHMALGRTGSQRVRLLHRGDMKARFEEARQALGLLDQAGKAFEAKAKAMGDRKLQRAEIEAFWLDLYQTVESEIPTDPQNAAESMSRNRALATVAQWTQNFDQELAVAGPTVWNAFNAATRWYDHQKPIKDDDRLMSRWFGLAAERKAAALEFATAWK